MAAIDFPDSPSINQTFSAGNKTWIWDGVSWNLVVVEAGLHGASHAAAGTDPIAISQSQVNGLSTDLGAKAPISNPTFTGIPAAPTAAADTNTTQIATTAYVMGQGYLKQTLINAKGDILAGTADDTAARVAVGTNGQVLVADSTQTAGVKWGTAGATGGGSDQAFYENDSIITTSYTISTNKNAVTAGPITVNSGAVVTVPSGSVWTVV